MSEKNNIDKKRIEGKISEIVDKIDSIKNKLPEDYKTFERMDFVKDGIYKRIEFAIQNVIDICYLINSGLRLGVPETEDDVFENLEKNKILSKKIINLINQMKGFRNILVHKYGKINDEMAFNSIREGLEDFEIIINEIEKFLKNN